MQLFLYLYFSVSMFFNQRRDIKKKYHPEIEMVFFFIFLNSNLIYKNQIIIREI
jgi:hypothetical protein